MQFEKNFPLKDIILSKINPRIISKKAQNSLKDSLENYGMIKPLVINKDNNELICGYQCLECLKKLNIRTAPVIKLSELNKQEEIRFNLFHNSLDTNNSKVWIDNFEKIPTGYSFIEPQDINFIKNEASLFVKEIGKLVLKYGAWGSVVCNENGKVIANSDYAVCCALLKQPLLVYRVKNKCSNELKKAVNSSYGRYYFDKLDVKDYHQTFCQMNKTYNYGLNSKLYEQYVIPNIKHTDRILDFGAGKCVYPIHLKKCGYKIFAYEPYIRVDGFKSFDVEKVLTDINEIEHDIENNGLYDVLILESVINSVTSLCMEHNVLLTANSLLREDGVLYVSARSFGDTFRYNNQHHSTSKRRQIEFLDDNNFSATFRNGVWTKQRFMTKDMIYKELTPYFNSVEIFGSDKRENIYAICKAPVRWTNQDYKRALEIEFNMEYPEGFKHNMHKKIVKTVIENLR